MQFDFTKAEDKDYPGKVEFVLLFNPKDEYKIKGRTHGLASHCIKHLRDLEKDKVDAKLFQLKLQIEKIPHIYLYRKDQGIVKRDKEAFRALTPEILINTMDLINDKVLTLEKLNQYDQLLIPIIQNFVDKYSNLLEEMIRKSISIFSLSGVEIQELINSFKIISFPVVFRGTSMTHYLDLKKFTIITAINRNIKTFYKADREYFRYLYGYDNRYKIDDVIRNTLLRNLE